MGKALNKEMNNKKINMYYGVNSDKNCGGKVAGKGEEREGLIFWVLGGPSEEENFIACLLCCQTLWIRAHQELKIGSPTCIKGNIFQRNRGESW